MENSLQFNPTPSVLSHNGSRSTLSLSVIKYNTLEKALPGKRKKHCQRRQCLENVFFTQSIKAIIRLKALLIKSNFVCEKSRQHLFFKQPIE